MSENTPEEEETFTFKDKRRRYEEDGETGENSSEPESSDVAAAEPEETNEPEPEAAAPPLDFSTIVLSIATSAAHHMGGFQDPVSGKTSINLELAKQSIDMLAILEEKTKGNLESDEETILTRSLYDLRMRFVEMSKSGHA